jgi:hypothetical protein
MIKAQIPNQILMEWFTKSLFPTITMDVSMVGLSSKEKDILHSQHLDLIFSHSRTLYDIIMHALISSVDPHKINPRPHVNGVVDFVSSAYVDPLSRQLDNMHISSNWIDATPTTQSYTFIQPSNHATKESSTTWGEEEE